MKRRRTIKPFPLTSDKDADFIDKRTYDVSEMEPQVAVPHNVDTGVPVSTVAGIPVDQVFIGSCTNGRFEDLEEAAGVLGKKKFSSNVRVIIIPASRDEYVKALRAGFIEKFVTSRCTRRSTLLWSLHGRGVRAAGTRRSVPVHIEPEFQGQTGEH